MMDFSIFDDEPEESGQEIEAFCPKCKGDTLHSVLGIEDEEARKVRCHSCDDTHSFRKPKGDDASDDVEPISVRKKASKAKPSWDHAVGKKKAKDFKAYNINEVFHEKDLIQHPTFGGGYVIELIGLDKIEVLFQDQKRVLVHNRQRMAIKHSMLDEIVAEAAQEAKNKIDLDALMELPDDLLEEVSAELENTKLSPQAWAALHEEDEDEETAGKDEDEHDFDEGEFEDDSDDDEDEDGKSRKKSKSSSKKSKTSSKKSSQPVIGAKGKSKAKSEPMASKSTVKKSAKPAIKAASKTKPKSSKNAH